MNKPLISIITPVFNGIATIEACMESVSNQTYGNKEHWIVDGGSTDGTVKILKKWAKKYTHIHYISEKDKGLYHAMNKGIIASKGEWLHFMGGDDILADKEVLEQVRLSIDARSELLLGKVALKNSNYTNLLVPVTSWKFFLFNSINHQGCFYKRSIFSRFMYDESKKIASDYKMNLSILTNNIPYKKINVTTCVYNVLGLSGREIFSHLKEMNQVRLELLPKAQALLFNSIASTTFYGMQILKQIFPTTLTKKIAFFFKSYQQKQPVSLHETTVKENSKELHTKHFL